MIFRLSEDELWFPDPRLGNPNGLFAVGGDLSAERLLLAYSHGIFPWFPFRDAEEVEWWCPMERFVIFPNEVHISHSLRTLLNKNEYRFSFNRDFEGVIRNCSRLRIEERGAWLGAEMVNAYIELHRRGFAASVEVWRDGELVGGLYGVTDGRCFFGESMFSLVPSGSKMALVFLAQTMARGGGVLIDCQFETPHLKSMGGRYISYDEYMRLVNEESIQGSNDENC